MANFGDFFLRGANSTFPQTFGRTFQLGLDQQEEQRKRNELLKAQQEQQGIMSVIINGRLSNAGDRGMYGISQPTFTPLSPEEKSLAFSKLSSQNQDAIKYYDKLTAPKQKKTVKIGDSIYQESPEYENVPVGEPIYTETKKIKPDFVEEEYGSNNEKIRYEFYKNDKGGYDKKEFPLGIYKRETKKDENGNNYETLSKDYLKELNQRTDKFFTAQDIKKATDLTRGGVPYVDPLTGVKYTIDSQTAESMVESGKTQLQNYLDMNGSVKNKKYWEDVNNESWNEIKKEGRGDHALTTWKYIEEDYGKGKITEADVLEAKYRFIAKWGFDPTRKFQ